ncbi:hypothetical protein P175DRAFT_0481623 [Aspergillus ochraceoroseus IBT 24754]|uniref:RNase III domain-containing protein n=3 Tax=Aspergillus subgen. Nidulantes TaxID=2720870 RepID=A0A0F8VR46_9EURO|nr:uncharacterized protein P175DRAFT_0481623 [Aspergillus ochraceoroseus IBT 24754]KKK24080.1 hypothetical protein AOCH_005319 [Aspergillus ochraceoroseus]KKK25661.1 hypothetical protein ARAM_003847 [Aspergillus rambellii]PTU20344.1 hypothetical protein P175DRAFT_0481623 [Aspergillus ochraceoroseus IBT 24754]
MFPPPSSAAASVEFLATLFDMEFADNTKIAKAFLAPGALDKEGHRPESLIGDSCIALYLRSQGLARNASVDLIDQVVCQIRQNKNLAQRGFDLGLGRHIYNNPSQRGYISHNLMATTVQAIIGVIFQEKGWDQDVLHHTMSVIGLTWPE